jgi:hypothetical protein
MKNVLLAFLSSLISTFRSRAILQLEILALRHQLSVYKNSKKRPKVKLADRISGFGFPGFGRIAMII